MNNTNLFNRTCMGSKMLLVVVLFLFCAISGYSEDILEWGFVDVTKSPFNADATGKKDCTEALQHAIDFAQSQRKVAFFPQGTYRISNTLHCRHAPPPEGERGDFEWQRYWGVTLLGSRSGTERPKIVLSPGSEGYDDVDNPKIMLNFYRGEKEKVTPKYPTVGPGFMNTRLVGIDVEIGKNNPGAIAVRMRGAQGCIIEDLTIDATHGLVGLEGANASGGGNANVTIKGGKIGFDGSASQETPTITGFTFIDQTKHAILYRGRQTLVATGTNIQLKHPIVAVKAVDMWTESETGIDKLNGKPEVGLMAWNGSITFVDSKIEFTGTPGTAFQSNAAVYLNNCYVKNAAVLLNHSDFGKTPGVNSNWLKVDEYATGYNMRPFDGKQYSAPIYIDSKKQENPVNISEIGIEPPIDLCSRHVWGKEFPSWESPGAVNVKMPPYNAKGDGINDDTEALQKAINENEIVFIPKGLYRVSRTIDLKSNTKLIGLMSEYTGLVVKEMEGDFADVMNPQPIIRTPDDANAEVVIAFIGTWIHENNACYNLLWRSGRKSIVRHWMIMHEQMQVMERTHQMAIVKGNGGGRWYNYYDEAWSLYHRPSYRHLYVEATTEPFRIYQCNPEHARSDANMEIVNSKNITLYGLKSEANAPVLRIRNSENIRVFGFGGNESPWPQTAIFEIENSRNLLFATIIQQVRMHKAGDDRFNGPNVNPELFYSLSELMQNGQKFIVPPLERPVLYKTGQTCDVW